MKTIYHIIIFTCLTLFNGSVYGQSLAEDLDMIRTQWANVNFQTTEKEQDKAFKQLVIKIDKLTQKHKQYAEPWIWSGIIKSCYAGHKGGLSALKWAKKAKKDLEKALKIDENALNGSAYASLGTLYHKVPGWPISFGDDDDAERFLKKALEIDPNGKEPNFFYGEYLYDDRQYGKAKEFLTIAKSIAPRIDSAIADKYRQIEIEMILSKVNKHLKKRNKR